MRTFGFIAVENLNIKGLAGGMLAGSVASVAWGAFLLILIAKAENAGRQVEKVDPRYTSQDCSGCGARAKKLLSQREHVCTSCGLVTHRDHNAAINILLRARGPKVKPVENDGVLRSRNAAAVDGRTERNPSGVKRRAVNRARL